MENLRTITSTYPDNSNVESGRIKSTLIPDKKLISYTYEQGEYNAVQHSFIPGSGDYVKTLAVRGTETTPTGIANKTTSEMHITDKLGNMVYQETSAYDGTNYHTIKWTEHEFDSFGRLIKTTSSNGAISESTWSCCGKESETNATGIITSFIYDTLNRLTDQTTESAKGDIVTHYTYDASNRRLTNTISSGGLSLSSSSLYDKAGRIINRTDNTGSTTTYSYQSGGSQTTITRPGGATEITTRYKDNRMCHRHWSYSYIL